MKSKIKHNDFAQHTFSHVSLIDLYHHHTFIHASIGILFALLQKYWFKIRWVYFLSWDKENDANDMTVCKSLREMNKNVKQPICQNKTKKKLGTSVLSLRSYLHEYLIKIDKFEEFFLFFGNLFSSCQLSFSSLSCWLKVRASYAPKLAKEKFLKIFYK